MSVTLSSNQWSALTSAAQQGALKASSSSTSAASASQSPTSSTSSASSSATALNSLSSDYNQFLTLFTAQLQAQDPTSPTDSSQFTSELVQYSGVEQQVQTNTNLTQLIQLTQAQELASTSSDIGKQVQLSGNTVPLQSGKATLDFSTATSEPVAIAITNSGGHDVKDVTLTSSAGSNSWSWNGTSNSGAQLPDGAYNVSIETSDATGTVTAIPFTTIATPTATRTSGNGISVSFGPTALPYSDIQSLQQ